MAKSLGFAVIEFSGEFHRIKPDIVLLIGDRYEALAAASRTKRSLSHAGQNSLFQEDSHAAR